MLCCCDNGMHIGTYRQPCCLSGNTKHFGNRGIDAVYTHHLDKQIMKIVSLAVIAASLLITGCASVDMVSKEESAKLKQFSAPGANNAGLYIYRNSSFGGALKKDIWIDGKCIGESAPNVFFYTEVAGGKTHKLSTESEFSPNDLELTVDSGKNYFVRQYIKMGAFVGGAGLEVIPEQQGKTDIAKLEMAKAGTCSGPRK